MTKTPEEAELDTKFAELAKLENELVQKELERATLEAELQAFELHYLKVVGARLARLDQLRAQLADAFARQHPADRNARIEAQHAHAQAEESERAHRAAAAEPPRQAVFKPSEAFKSLYKEAARKVHPDLASDEQDRERRNRAMAEVNRAYHDGNEASLRKILEEWESSPDAVQGEGIGSRLIRAIRTISQARNRLAETDRLIEDLQKSDLFILFNKVRDAGNRGEDLLAQMVAQLDSEIRQVESSLQPMGERT